MFYKIKNRIYEEKGIVAITVALALIVIIGIAAYGIDVGGLYEEKAAFQNAVDAAALAGAQELPNTSRAASAANDYIELNGYSSSDISITFSDLRTIIYIDGTTTHNYNLAGVLGFNSAEVYAHAAAEKITLGECFNYALFSGSTSHTLTINGSNQYVGGSSHTNQNFTANGSNITITGACEAAGTITVNGTNININNRIPHADYIEMPDFSESLRLQAQKAGTLYVGNKTFNGSSINVDSPIYVQGNVTINGSRFRGTGFILATGNITFNGSNLNQTTEDAVCFYSKNGNITVNGSGITLDGIVYAPSGSIILNGSSQTIHGRVIGNTVSINGSGLSIQSGENELKALKYSIRLIE